MQFNLSQFPDISQVEKFVKQAYKNKCRVCFREVSPPAGVQGSVRKAIISFIYMEKTKKINKEEKPVVQEKDKKQPVVQEKEKKSKPIYGLDSERSSQYTYRYPRKYLCVPARSRRRMFQAKNTPEELLKKRIYRDGL